MARNREVNGKVECRKTGRVSFTQQDEYAGTKTQFVLEREAEE